MDELVFWQMLASCLAGCVGTGVLMLLRGDFLGSKAAAEAEDRLNNRMDRELQVVSSELQGIKGTLERVEQRLYLVATVTPPQPPNA